MSIGQRRRGSTTAAWLLLCGLSIGWLSGLSVSPVLATVLSSLLAALGGVVAGLHTVDTHGEKGQLTTAAPIALLLLGVAVAAPLGVMVRTHCLLERGGECTAEGRPATAADGRISARVGGLFNSAEARQHWCQEALRAPDQRLANTLLRVRGQSPWVAEIANAVESPEELRRIVEAICADN